MRLVAIMVALAAIAGPAGAAAVPDSARIAHLQKRANAAWRVKVTTLRETWVVSDPRMDLEGVTVVRPRGSFGDMKEQRVSWTEIQSLDTVAPGVVRRSLGGVLIGAGAGYLLGAVYVDTQLENADGSVIVPIFSAGAGAAAGLVVGLIRRKPPERIYP